MIVKIAFYLRPRDRVDLTARKQIYFGINRVNMIAATYIGVRQLQQGETFNNRLVTSSYLYNILDFLASILLSSNQKYSHRFQSVRIHNFTFIT